MEEYELLIKEIETDGYEIDSLRESIHQRRNKILALKTRIKANQEKLNRKFQDLSKEEFLVIGYKLGYLE